MPQNEKIAALQGELQTIQSKLDSISTYYSQFKKDFSDRNESKNYDLVIFSNIISDYYTCLETAFVRISKFFENNLDSDRWHKQLLENMRIEIPGIRQAVINGKTYDILSEFLRFRHFKRYYYDYNYDRDRMIFLEKKLLQSIPMVKKDLAAFNTFLEALRN